MIKCAFDRENGCAALKEKPCMIGKPCSFRKSAEELTTGREKAKQRISELPFSWQEDIKNKYHGTRSVDKDEAQ